MQKHYNKKYQKSVRKRLRNNTTFSEKLLWSKIRNKQLGVKFRRQFGIDNYVVDFYCPEIKLAVELDGGTHETEMEVERDKARQEHLERLNIKVRRYTNIDVKENLEGVLIDLMKEVGVDY